MKQNVSFIMYNLKDGAGYQMFVLFLLYWICEKTVLFQISIFATIRNYTYLSYDNYTYDRNYTYLSYDKKKCVNVFRNSLWGFVSIKV